MSKQVQFESCFSKQWLKKLPVHLLLYLHNVATFLTKSGNFGPRVTEINRFHCNYISDGDINRQNPLANVA